MGEKNVNVEIDEELWRRVRVRAALEQKAVKRWVSEALRLLLASPEMVHGSVVTETGPVHGVPAAVMEDSFGGGSSAQPRPTKDQLQALIDQVPAQRTATVNALKGSIVESNRADPRHVERERRAAQDRLRTHPEDDSQVDPKVDF